MNLRIEVTEQQWVAGLRDADYVVLDLGDTGPRPWLSEAVREVELVGRAPGPADAALLEFALELDVDFLALTTVSDGFDARRLPIRLVVEQDFPEVEEAPELLGAAWARRIDGWAEGDRDALAELARRERIFLAPGGGLPDDTWLAAVVPFAIAAPPSCDPAEIARIRDL
jgi:hypothetical protein